MHWAWPSDWLTCEASKVRLLPGSGTGHGPVNSREGPFIQLFYRLQRLYDEMNLGALHIDMHEPLPPALFYVLARVCSEDLAQGSANMVSSRRAQVLFCCPRRARVREFRDASLPKTGESTAAPCCLETATLHS